VRVAAGFEFPLDYDFAITLLAVEKIMPRFGKSGQGCRPHKTCVGRSAWIPEFIFDVQALTPKRLCGIGAGRSLDNGA
jgi:hypothetical protein